MISRFFIDRPIFAWVIALFIAVFGIGSITQLPVAQYPTVAPPSIVISVAYPGASAEVLSDTVLAVIERELNGAAGMIYMESVAQSNGVGTITATFEPGSSVDLAQIEVQNRVTRATPRLPAAVTQQGVRIDKARTNFLAVVTLTTSRPDLSREALADYVARNVQPEIQRIDGVGNAQLFGAERAMRIWIDPAKLRSTGISPAEVVAAIRAQNVQVPGGSLGDLPLEPGQAVTATLVVGGQLDTPQAFGAIVLRARADGGAVHLRDVARIEVGSQDYNTNTRLNGKPAVGVGVQLTPTANALATATALHARLEELKAQFPQGVEYRIPFDTSNFVRISISQVVETLAEAVVLVFLVMLLFLQNLRYTLIPTVVVPIALLGTFTMLRLFGFSINTLTLFGMVLAIGILVDDAIVVVENVERIMADEGLSPRDATAKAMSQITGAVIGITVVLMSVFIPMAFFAGSVGNIYRQFSLSMVTAIGFSAFLALTLTPALCANFLTHAVHHDDRKGFYGLFNNVFRRTAKRYEGSVARILPHAARWLVAFAVILAVVGWGFKRLPTSFLPTEDQGYLIVNVQLPPGATAARTSEVIKQAEGWLMAQPEVADVIAVMGFSFSGQGQNAGIMFAALKNWDERKGAAHTAQALTQRAMGPLLGGIRDGIVFALIPPSIPELGTATGFNLRLEDRNGMGHDALVGARNQMLGLAARSKVVTGVRPDGLEDAPQLLVDIDRERAYAQGVSFDAISTVLGTAMGSAYANDFPNQGRLQRVVVQADAPDRMTPEDVLQLDVPSSSGKLVPLSAFATTRWASGPMQIVRYNGYPAMRLSGDALPGLSTGQAMTEMENFTRTLPPGFSYEWTGLSREEKLSGSQVIWLMALSLLAVFLALAALYESWSIPFAVLLVVPLGVLGALLGVMLRGMPNDVYFKVGLITVIGLSAKNAILIVEFARHLQAEGKGLIAATLEACHLRFRPIVMTSMAFMLGVLPLALANGAGASSQRAIGTGVLGGMITATVLAIGFVPVFFVVLRRLSGDKDEALPTAPAAAPPPVLPGNGEHAR